MEKAKRTMIYIWEIDGIEGQVRYDADSASDLGDLLCNGLITMIDVEDAELRKEIRKACRCVLRKTRSRRAWEWIHSAQVGIVAIPAVCGVMWLIGQIGHALGVM